MGYVGLPLACEFGKIYQTIGFDLNEFRIRDLKAGNDYTNELNQSELRSAEYLSYSDDLNQLKDCNFFIVTVPTPIDRNNLPDTSALESASKMVGQILKKEDIVVYESTVYPGLTEELLIPILESESGLKSNIDFFYGYSPERINPGDKKHRITDIKKITSGSNPQISILIDDVYSSIITAGTFKASSVMVAEAAKVIENIQRDVNIALINELSIIFGKLGIDTEEVLKAARTKWNFHSYKPGLVGGHCIGVDPYYLTFKAENIGYKTKVILSGRELNDSMGGHIASKFILAMCLPLGLNEVASSGTLIFSNTSFIGFILASLAIWISVFDIKFIILIC